MITSMAAQLVKLQGCDANVIPLCNFVTQIRDAGVKIVSYIKVYNNSKIDFTLASDFNISTVIGECDLETLCTLYAQGRRWLSAPKTQKLESFRHAAQRCDQFLIDKLTKEIGYEHHYNNVKIINILKMPCFQDLKLKCFQDLLEYACDVESEKRRRNKLVGKIQRVFRRVNTDPSHIICTRRLQYEFMELVS